ncbi:MAG: DMT family transporter [Burkholderiales bacterium]|nr:DMT family transporter [Burkholderiales bacterium]
MPPPLTTTTASPWGPISALLLNAFLWGIAWWPFRWLSERGLHSLWATAAIYLVAWLVIVVRQPSSALASLRHPGLLALAVASGMTNTCFNWGVSTGEVVRVVLLFYLMPIWAVLLARLLMGEPLRALSIGLVLLAVIGAGIVLWRPGVGVPLPASRADWLGVAGGMFFTLTNVLLLKQAATASASRAAAMFAGATVIPGVVALAMGASGADVPLPALQSGALLPLVLVAVLFLAGNLALQFGAARLPTRVTAVVMLSEVVFAALSAVWLGDEVLTLQMTLGATLIIGASLLSALSSRR